MSRLQRPSPIVVLFVVIVSLAWCATPRDALAAALGGASSGTFEGVTPAVAVVTGAGTSQISWGAGTAPSRLRFTGMAFDVQPEQDFPIGTLEFFNGTTQPATNATSAELRVSLAFTAPAGVTEQLVQLVSFQSTANTSDPVASADMIFFHPSFPQASVTVGGIEYNVVFVGFGTVVGDGFTSLGRFHVFEGGTARVQLLARITSACVVPAGGAVVEERITGSVSCGTPGTKSPTWGRFGARSALQSDAGETLSLVCRETSPGVTAFELHYTPPGGTPIVVGACPFAGGCNEGYFYHAGADPKTQRPRCLLRTVWISKDYGANDSPNAWTGETSDDTLDWAETLYDVTTGQSIRRSHKYEYATPPPLQCSVPGAEGAQLAATRIEPPAPGGLAAAAVSDLTALAVATEPAMRLDSTQPCDLDGNGRCDGADVAVFDAALGTCEGDAGYRRDADRDGDGCVTLLDRSFLFPQDLAVVTMQVPRVVTRGGGTRSVLVGVQNRSGASMTVVPAHLGNGIDTGLVRLRVDVADDDAEQCTPAVVTLDTTRNARLFTRNGVAVVAPNGILTVAYRVTYRCNSPAVHRGDTTLGDYRHSATVHHEAIDGTPDTHPADDVCPRNPVAEPTPGRIGQDRGCGLRQRNGSFAAFTTDVTP